MIMSIGQVRAASSESYCFRAEHLDGRECQRSVRSMWWSVQWTCSDCHRSSSRSSRGYAICIVLNIRTLVKLFDTSQKFKLLNNLLFYRLVDLGSIPKFIEIHGVRTSVVHCECSSKCELCKIADTRMGQHRPSEVQGGRASVHALQKLQVQLLHCSRGIVELQCHNGAHTGVQCHCHHQTRRCVRVHRVSQSVCLSMYSHCRVATVAASSSSATVVVLVGSQL